MTGFRECFVREDNGQKCKQTTRRQHFVSTKTAGGGGEGSNYCMYVHNKHWVR